MLSGENFISNYLDLPKTEVSASFQSNLAVAVSCHLDANLNKWIKKIQLDLCDRFSLASLFHHLRQIRKFSPLKCNKSFEYCNDYLSLPIDISLEGSVLNLQYEYFPNGSVQDILFQRKKGFDEITTASIISRIILCVNKLHNNGYLHRGLCSRHILIKNSNSDDSLDIVLCGLSSLTHILPIYHAASRSDLPFLYHSWRNWKTSNSFQAHPIAFYSPELLAQDFSGYNCATDVYSIGMIMHELFTAKPPYQDLTPSLILLKKMTQEDTPTLLSTLSDDQPSSEMQIIFNSCIDSDPTKRPSIQNLLEMPWIKRGLSHKLTESDLKNTD